MWENVWKVLGVIVTAAGVATPLLLIAYWVHRKEKKEEEAHREAYEYATSDRGIKDAAKRHAKFLKGVQEELSSQEEKGKD